MRPSAAATPRLGAPKRAAHPSQQGATSSAKPPAQRVHSPTSWRTAAERPRAARAPRLEPLPAGSAHQPPGWRDYAHRPAPLRGIEIPADTSQFLRERTASRAAAWASAGASQRELAWLKHGYRLEFAREPPPRFHKGVSLKNLTADQREWVRNRLQTEVDLGALEQATCDMYVSKAFLVERKDEETGEIKRRLVLDLTTVNPYLRRLLTRFETLKKLGNLVKRDDWLLSLDITAGFYCVPVHPESRKYLTFEVEGFGMFQFAALPMGLSTSPYVFCKLMRTFVRALRAPTALTATPLAEAPATEAWLPPHRRPPKAEATAATKPQVLNDLLPRFRRIMRRGLRVLPYMDDFLILCDSLPEALEAREYITAVLELLGLSRNEKKGVWEPTHALQHLGLGVDTEKGVFFVTPGRQAKVQRAAREILGVSGANNGLIPRRRLAGFVGLAQSLALAVPRARAHLRSLHDVIATGENWAGHVRLSRQARLDLAWWTKLATNALERPIRRAPTTVTLHCDSSLEGWGAALQQGTPQEVLARGFWAPHERRHHITLLETRAVDMALQSFLRTATEAIKGQHILLFEDNMAVTHILREFVSKSPAIMAEVRSILNTLDDASSTLEMTWLPSEENSTADSLSRMADRGDWRLQRRAFLQLDRDWGPHTVDRFATARNRQLPRYNSAWADPQTAGIDAFAQLDWKQQHNWCNPPWALLDRLAQHLDETGSSATVVAPFWPAQAWFQRLQAISTEWRRLPSAPGLFEPGRPVPQGSVRAPAWDLACFRVPGRR